MRVPVAFDARRVGRAGAVALGSSIDGGPDWAYFRQPHFMVRQPLQPLSLDLLGVAATSCALAAWLVFAWPMLRFVLTRPKNAP